MSIGCGKKKAFSLTLPPTNTTGMPLELNTPGPGLTLLTARAVRPVTLPSMMKLSAREPGPPRKASTPSVELPEALKASPLLKKGLLEGGAILEMRKTSPAPPSTSEIVPPALSNRSRLTKELVSAAFRLVAA